jgi:hypothetical protein
MAAKSKQLPVGLRNLVDRSLEPRERVVWTGQPRASEGTVASLIMTGLMLGVWAAFSFSTTELHLPWLMIHYVAFVTIVLPPFTFFLWQRSILLETCYVLTDRHALVFAPDWRRGHVVFVCLPEYLVQVRCRSFRNGFGSVLWGEPIGVSFHGAIRWRGGFAFINNAPEVHALMCETFLPLVLNRLKGPNPTARRNAALSLAEAGPFAKKAIPYLLASLDSDDSVVRHLSARALGEIGAEARSAVHELRRLLLVDESRSVAETARRAVHQIEHSQINPS